MVHSEVRFEQRRRRHADMDEVDAAWRRAEARLGYSMLRPATARQDVRDALGAGVSVDVIVGLIDNVAWRVERHMPPIRAFSWLRSVMIAHAEGRAVGQVRRDGSVVTVREAGRLRDEARARGVRLAMEAAERQNAAEHQVTS